MTAPAVEQAECVLPLGVHAVAAGRHFVENTLPSWGAGPDETATSVLLASELVTNAVLYGYGARLLTLRREADRVRVMVFDGAPGMPQSRNPGDDSEIGRGMQVIEACADAWGVEPREDGKIVWCELSIRGT